MSKARKNRITAALTGILCLMLLIGCIPAGRIEPAQPSAEAETASGEHQEQAREKAIVLVADEWMPFNGVAGQKLEGYMIDIAREIFAGHGFEVDYRNVAWSRAIQGTREGMFDGAVGASRSDGEGLVFPDEELADNYLAFYVRKGDAWRFTGEESLAGRCLGVIKSYDYRPWLAAYIERYREDPERVQVITGDTPLEQNINKLLLERIDVVVDNEASIRHMARSMDVLDQIEPAGYGSIPAKCYIAFTPMDERGEQYAGWLSEGIAGMRESGRLEEILDGYGLVDWRIGESPAAEHEQGMDQGD